MEQRDEEMGRREENRGPERASESEEIDRTLEQIMDNQKQEKKKRPGKKKWILAAGILGLGILGIKMVSTGGSQTPVVAVIPLEKQDIQEKLSISGPVSGTDSVDVVSNIHAEILQMNVKEGDKVIKGQVLAVLDRTELEREVNIANIVTQMEEECKKIDPNYKLIIEGIHKQRTNIVDIAKDVMNIFESEISRQVQGHKQAFEKELYDFVKKEQERIDRIIE